ncbi:serine carboxypeptidase-like [Tripterygium wilfordii]|uniref:serine carboxypeptidase-like n=1 Tax=Tripterygium wilfordii TaxID=458696 RepID=UPI0018F80826|nr:serine carboxypeptidase-like [Tripterygium wilfordii]
MSLEVDTRNTLTTMASSTFIHISLSLFLSYLAFHSSMVAAKSANHRFVSSRTNNSLEQHATRLIRSLNLLREDDLNIIDDNSTRLVDKQFELPFLDASDSSVKKISHHAGYIKLPRAKGARMFYLFFKSRYNKNHPVVLWLTGGPGCSGELALFYENGPFHITKSLSLVWNEYGWDKVSNIIYVDQPTGTGFSYTTDKNDVRHNEFGVSNDLCDFLQMFFKKHHQFAKNNFFITGESYAGHYIPALASRIHQENKENKGIHINLKGFAIGNGLTNPGIQYPAYPDFARNVGLITDSDRERIEAKVPQCKLSIEACDTGGENDCLTAQKDCEIIFQEILNSAIDVNYYDIRIKCKAFEYACYDFSRMMKFLRKKIVMAALGVAKHKFFPCSYVVYKAMSADWMKNLEVGIPSLLEDGIKVLIYVGNKDLICNSLGNSRWVEAMKWSGQENYGVTPIIPFVVGNADAGKLKNYGPLTFLEIYEAGHMVPMDQPEAALVMIERWTKGELVDGSN